jgi:hypothetical protein
MAAALCGRSAKALRSMIRRGELTSVGTGSWMRIPLCEVERLRNEPVTVEAWMIANHQRRARAQRATRGAKN